MTMKLLLTLALLALFALMVHRMFFSFPAQQPADYAGTSPTFDARQHLSGDLLSEGVIFGPTGRVISRFTARMNGVWSNSGGVLTEDFVFASGETLQREWTITPTGSGGFTATAPDIEGQAVGELSGATLRMRYRLRIGEGSGGHLVNVTDWIYLTGDGVMINRSEMRKFGVKVAELVATIRPAR